MAWEGYYSFGGTEIVNVERTARYAINDGAYWFRDTFKNDTLHYALGDDEYRTPLMDDDVPWVDPNDEDSYGFYGFYPLHIDGIDDSTRTSTIVENTGDGGNVGRLRHATKAVVFSGVLIGDSDAAVESGMRWLRSALLAGSGGCTDPSRGGTQLCYYRAEPEVQRVTVEKARTNSVTDNGNGTFTVTNGNDNGDGTFSVVDAYPGQHGTFTLTNIDSIEQVVMDASCADDDLRFLWNVVVNNGPTVTAKHNLSDGSAAWEVQFTAVAGIPWEFGLENSIISQAFSSLNPMVVADGVDIDLTGYIAREVGCPGPYYTPVTDPLCPDLILPPSIPVVPLGCYAPPSNWKRITFRIPADYLRQWTDMVPVVRIHTDTIHEVRNLRLRFFADPNGDVDPEDTPCAFCADMLVSYVPTNGTLVLDGRDETVKFQTAAASRRADGLVYDSNRMPLTWPQLSCGTGYLVVVDMQQTQVRPTIDFSLVPKAR